MARGLLPAVARRDHRTAALTEVRDAYGSWAADYTDLFGSADKASTEDRAVITAWAETVTGPVLDAGCGPGHWSAFLRTFGLQVEGVDATPAFVQHAARTYPDIPFHLGDLRSLELAPASLGGILAWFSLIHLDPAEAPQALRTFSAALHPEGKLLVGYFTGPDLQPFDHRVVTAWAWPVPRMRELLESAGFEVLCSDEHPQASGRIFAEVAARRSS